MSKTFKTQAEIFQALLAGKLIVRKDYRQHWIRMVDGFVMEREVSVAQYIFNSPEDWLLYEGPKPKKQVWQWRFKRNKEARWIIHGLMLTEEDAKEVYSSDHKYEKHAGPFEVED